MNFRLVTSLRDFDALAPMWRELTMVSGQRSPFVSHDWFACCWRTAGPNRRREVWIAENGGGPVAFIPLIHERTRIRGLPARLVRFLHSPDTPFTDLPIAGDPEEVLGTFFRTLRDRRDWDVLLLEKLPTHSPIHKVINAGLSGALVSRVASVESSPYVTISGTWDDFLRGKTPRFRKTFRSVENRMHREGDVQLEEHQEVDPGGPVFAEVMDVSRQSWKGPRGLAMATMEAMPRFFRDFTERASVNGWLRLWILRLNGRAVATEYQVSANGCVHALRADYDAALAEASPGAYLNARIVQSFFRRRGIHQYEMGPGTNPYKLRWATGTHQIVTLEVYPPTAYGRLLHGLETRLVPLARRLRDVVVRRSA